MDTHTTTKQAYKNGYSDGHTGISYLTSWAEREQNIVTNAVGRINDIEIVLGDLDDAYRFHRRVEKMRQRQQWRNKR